MPRPNYAAAADKNISAKHEDDDEEEDDADEPKKSNIEATSDEDEE